MEFGIFETVYLRPTPEATYAAVAEAGFTCVQCHLEVAGIDPSAGDIDGDALQRLGTAAAAASVRLPAVSGTFNMAHPDPAARADGLRVFERVVGAARQLGATFVTICTGTRDTTSMWKEHPDNVTDAAWRDMLVTVEAAIGMAEVHGVTLLVEPEPANIASSALKARQLLDHFGNDRLKIVLDPANVVLSDLGRNPAEVLEESFRLLGSDIAFAHAKDVSAGGSFCAAGTGIVPWNRYRQLLEGIGYNGDVIFHTLSESDVPLAKSVFS